MSALSERERITMHGVFDLLQRRAARTEHGAVDDDEAVVIEHEGPTEPRDA